MKSYVPVETAREALLSSVGPVGEETVLLDDANGRRLAEPVESPGAVPPFDNSSRDGYAFRFDDIDDEPGRELTVVDTAAAGDGADRTVKAGEATRILTGAPMPEGADTVVMQEHVEVLRDGEAIVLEEPPDERGAWIRKAGRFLQSGEVALEPGDILDGPEVGLLASFGRSSVSVYRRPTVAVITAGDELVDVDEVPGPAEIIDSNRYQLSALIRQIGAEVVRIPGASDSVVDVRRAFRQGIRAADLVVSVGGVSVGDRDVVRTVLDELTGGLELYRIRMKPGKPLAFGVATDDAATPLVGVPGNPNSCFVCFQQFVRPMLGVMEGADPKKLGLRSLTATLATETTSPPGRREYQAGTLVRPDDRSEGSEQRDGTHELVFRPAVGQSSGDPSLFCGADAFGIVPEDIGRLDAGSPITVELLPN